MEPCWIGAPDAQGRALVLVHGAGGCHALWEEVRVALRARGVPVLALDLPGHGRAPGVALASVEALAAYAAAALAEAGADCYTVAGHSLGGAVALTLAAARAPGLRGVAAVSTGARLPVDPRIRDGALKAFACTVENLTRFVFARGAPPEALARVRATMSAVAPETLHADFTACSGYALAPQALRRIDAAAEVVCGDADVLTPPALSDELAATIPGAHLTRLPGVGHTPQIEAPGPLADALARLWGRAMTGSSA